MPFVANIHSHSCPVMTFLLAHPFPESVGLSSCFWKPCQPEGQLGFKHSNVAARPAHKKKINNIQFYPKWDADLPPGFRLVVVNGLSRLLYWPWNQCQEHPNVGMEGEEGIDFIKSSEEAPKLAQWPSSPGFQQSNSSLKLLNSAWRWNLHLVCFHLRGNTASGLGYSMEVSWLTELTERFLEEKP